MKLEKSGTKKKLLKIEDSSDIIDIPDQCVFSPNQNRLLSPQLRHPVHRIMIPKETIISSIDWKDLYNMCLCSNGYAMLIDTRSTEEYQASNIPTSMNVPDSYEADAEENLVDCIHKSSQRDLTVNRSFRFRSGKTVILYDNEGGAFESTADNEKSVNRWRDRLALGFLKDGEVTRVYVMRKPLETFLQEYPFVTNPLPETKYPNEILKYLYLGNYKTALQAEVMKAVGITHIVNCCAEVTQCRNNLQKSLGIQYLNVIEIADNPFSEIDQYFEQVYNFIESALEEGKDKAKVFVHCYAGVSRSSTFVISYLMRKKKLRLKDAFNHTLSCRSAIDPNEGFRTQLLGLERTLFGTVTIDEKELMDLGNHYQHCLEDETKNADGALFIKQNESEMPTTPPRRPCRDYCILM